MKLKKLLLALILSTGLFVFVGVFSQASAATLLINPPFGNVEAGKDLDVDVVVTGQDELVDGVDAIVAYDSNFLKVKEIKKGNFFTLYPRLKDDSGQVKITALAPKEGVKLFGDIVVATVIFEVMDSGETDLKITYKEGVTSDSNVVEHSTTKDLLTKVSDGNYEVEATPEKLQAARARRATQSGLMPLLVFIILVIIGVAGFWYYRKKRKPKQDYFVPEAFPMDELPKSEEEPKDTKPPTN